MILYKYFLEEKTYSYSSNLHQLVLRHPIFILCMDIYGSWEYLSLPRIAYIESRNHTETVTCTYTVLKKTLITSYANPGAAILHQAGNCFRCWLYFVTNNKQLN